MYVKALLLMNKINHILTFYSMYVKLYNTLYSKINFYLQYLKQNNVYHSFFLIDFIKIHKYFNIFRIFGCIVTIYISIEQNRRSPSHLQLHLEFNMYMNFYNSNFIKHLSERLHSFKLNIYFNSVQLVNY